MEKKIINTKDIQRELLLKLNKKKTAALYFTAFLCVSFLGYIWYAVNYFNGIYLKPRHFSFVSPSAVMIIAFIIILILTYFLLKVYYLDLYKIKKEKFNITTEKLLKKEKELKTYYRKTVNENALYFSCGRIAVENEVYSSSCIGDGFYVVRFRSSKNPASIYNAKLYEIT